MRKRICAPSMPTRSITRRKPAPVCRKKSRRLPRRNPARTIRKTGRSSSRAAPARECWYFRSQTPCRKMYWDSAQESPCSQKHFLPCQPERRRADKRRRCRRQLKKTGHATAMACAASGRAWKSTEDTWRSVRRRGGLPCLGICRCTLLHHSEKIIERIKRKNAYY